MANLIGAGPTFRAMALRLFVKFLGETVGQAEVDAMLDEGEVAHAESSHAEAQSRGEGKGKEDQENDEGAGNGHEA
jgi:hypothetical protein